MMVAEIAFTPSACSRMTSVANFVQTPSTHDLSSGQHRRNKRLNGRLFTLAGKWNASYTLQDRALTGGLRAANKHARFQRMLDFQGPETGTMELLQAHKDECMSKPSAFWNYAPLLGPVGLELQARIVMCY